MKIRFIQYWWGYKGPLRKQGFNTRAINSKNFAHLKATLKS